MNLLVGCEESQAICKAARDEGINAYSCDLQECSGGHPEWHIIEDVRIVMMGGSFLTQAGTKVYISRWDKAIFHPACTYLTCSAEWAYKDPDYVRYPGVGYHQKLKTGTLFGADRRKAREESLQFVCDLFNAPIDEIIVENPVGVISTQIVLSMGLWSISHSKTKGISPQIVHPHWFGDDASKATAFYFIGTNKRLQATNNVSPRIVNGKKRWGNQCDNGGHDRTPPSPNRAKQRSKTFPGIAQALIKQCIL